MKGIIIKVWHFVLSEAAKKILLIVSLLVIFDVLLAILGGSYLSENIGAFLGKSRTAILSDLLFLEGLIILAIGIFIAVGRIAHETKPISKSSTEATVNAELTGEKRTHPSTLMIIIGAVLIGLSITVGTLLL